MALREKSIKKAYPLDSSASPVSFDENGAPVYDREYNASDIRKTYARYFSDGVFTAVGEKLLVKRAGGTWYVHPGSAMCAGLRIDLDERTPVVDQADITPGKYAYVCVEARFDSALNDGHVYARLSSSPTERPVRTASNHEVILARINWDGAITDLRLDNGYCGPVRFLFDVDTDNFVDALETKLGQFDLSVGLVEALSPDERPYVTVTKPTDPGDPTVVGFGLPQGPTGPKGATGATGPKGDTGPRGAAAVTDASLSTTSTNAVCNSVVTTEINKIKNSISQGAVSFKNNTTLTISAYKVGRIVIVSGYGELNVKANSDIALASNLPAAAADARFPVAVQASSDGGAIVSIYKGNTSLHLETKNFSGSGAWCFFSVVYAAA